MTTLERMRQRRNELEKQAEQVRALLHATLGAIQALDEQIAAEQAPDSAPEPEAAS